MVMQAPLSKPHRTLLESTVKQARDLAEKAARAALAQLGVGEGRVPDYLDEGQRDLRRRLRAHGRALGDPRQADGTQELRRLVWEVAYEHWHRMLFARFLAENSLLLWEPGAPVSLEDCRALVDQNPELCQGARSQWELAGRLAARMLPQVFKPTNPVFELAFAPEHQRELERLLAGLPAEVFAASDSLGWVYQFWQARRKDEVNASEVKIGADELPAVTQLFTEPYMVDFLLHNSLGAWWATRHPDRPCPVELPYLRTLEDGTPAAGRFEGWPDHLAEFRLLDPCCGSGHFLVAALLLLVPMRQAAEGLTAAQAVDAVLRQNLHGLEIDPRCVEIAVFALALAAWRYPDEAGQPLGVRAEMPSPRVACCGLAVSGTPQDWAALVPADHSHRVDLRDEMRRLHRTFAQAPLLGSLLDPTRDQKGYELVNESLDVQTFLERALVREEQAAGANQEALEWACAARGLHEAAQLLAGRYHLVVTNVPYLKSGHHCLDLKNFLKNAYPEAASELATVFLQRTLELVVPGGTSAIVTQQYWMFLKLYERLRRSLIRSVRMDLLAVLGPGAFDSISGEVVNPCLQLITAALPDPGHLIRGLDVTPVRGSEMKGRALIDAHLESASQAEQANNPDARISLRALRLPGEQPLSKIADFGKGSVTGDSFHYLRMFWESSEATVAAGYRYWLNAPSRDDLTSGREHVVLWRVPGHDFRTEVGFLICGERVWGKQGLAIAKAGKLRFSIYHGEVFDDNIVVLVPRRAEHYAALWRFCCSPDFESKLRSLDKKMSITAGTFTKVSVDLCRYESQEEFVRPSIYSDDPTQWLFHGHPKPSTSPLQVAVARLLGYRWPAESDAEMELSEKAREWIAHCRALEAHTDDDGIVCLGAVRGERPAHERLLNLLIQAWESVEPGSWKAGTLDHLLAEAGCPGRNLEWWLREKFFEQHAKTFHHRPFVWHVWDGLKDGFGALVNYHRLDGKNLERLVHTYLGDWISQQDAGVRDGVDGAGERLAAARDLKSRLERILEGEAPHDIFVRWKPLAQQPIGWEPDLNDGVRLNIRPFMTAQVLRHNKPPKLNVKWEKDRGKDVQSAPWFHLFRGERINDHHLSLAEKRAARR
jgi:hypothetical protein